jgi:glycosyltransferase 2 family protein
VVARNVLYIVSLGFALYLLLPLLPGLEHSVDVMARASKPLLVAALAAELCSLLCYSELLARSVVAAARMRPSLERRRRSGLGPWFAFRLAVCGLGAGRVFPGGGALLAAIALVALRRRGFGMAEVSLALVSFSLLVYGALGTLCAAAFFYLVAHHDVATITAMAGLVLFVVLTVAVLAAYVAYRRSPHPEGLAEALVLRMEHLLPHRGLLGGQAAERARRLAATLRKELRVAGEELLGRPSRLMRLGALAFGYWLLDALCLFFIFSALGTEVEPWKLLVAYATAQLVQAMPFMPPGGLGVTEGAFISMFALLGMSPGATVIPVLGYRLLNYWMPIPLAAIFYPTLSLGAKKARARKVS